MAKRKKQGGETRPESDSTSAATNHERAGESAIEADRESARRSRTRRDELCENQTDHAAAGDGIVIDAEKCDVASKSNGHAMHEIAPNLGLHGSIKAASVGGNLQAADNYFADTCRQIQEIYRQRNHLLKTRVMLDNRLVAFVASELGYFAGMEEADREERWQAAKKLIKEIEAGDDSHSNPASVRVAGLVTHDRATRANFQSLLDAYEKQLSALGEQLPAADFAKSIKGFGVLRLACIIGGTGDLSKYANPAKVWKRLGLAPHNGKMPSTWRRSGGLSAEEWTEIGYSPSRRSLMFVITDLLVKLNFEGSGETKTAGKYRQVFLDAKAKAKEKHEDWTPAHVNNHGHLLMAKRLVLDLWITWNKAARELAGNPEKAIATARNTAECEYDYETNRPDASADCTPSDESIRDADPLFVAGVPELMEV